MEIPHKMAHLVQTSSKNMKIKSNKKLIFKALFLPTLIFANQNYSNENFEKALESYNNRAFQDSYLAFKEYLKKEKLDSNLTFILARSAYEIGKLISYSLLNVNLLTFFAQICRLICNSALCYAERTCSQRNFLISLLTLHIFLLFPLFLSNLLEYR